MLRKGRVYSLAYADDVVLMSENEAGMRLMIGEFEKYVREKDLWINVEKIMVMRFMNERDRKQNV